MLPVDSWNACENVTRPPGGGGPGGGGPGGDGGGGGGGGQLALATPKLRSLAKIVKRGAMTVPVGVPGAGKITVRAYVDRKTARKARISAKRLVAIGKGSKTMAAAGKANVKVKLTSKARKRLRRYRKAIKVTLKLTYTPESGKSVTRTRKVSLKK